MASLLGAWLLAFVAYQEGPPVAHTGGFGEPTCQACHFDAPLDAPEGFVRLDGLPGAYVPGQGYRVTVILHHPEMRVGGFQVATRFADGTQAGRLDALDVYTRPVWDTTGVQYLHHTHLRDDALPPDTARWTFVWTAPAASGPVPTAPAPVAVHLAANTANGDNSPLGDYLYLQHTILPPVPAE